MALMSTQLITRSGVNPSYAAVSASDTFTPNANTFIHVKNAGASPDAVVPTVVSGANPAAGLTLTSASVSVTNAQERMIGPFPAQFFADPITGLCTVTHGFTTSVTAGVFQLAQP